MNPWPCIHLYITIVSSGLWKQIYSYIVLVTHVQYKVPTYIPNNIIYHNFSSKRGVKSWSLVLTMAQSSMKGFSDIQNNFTFHLVSRYKMSSDCWLIKADSITILHYLVCTYLHNLFFWREMVQNNDKIKKFEKGLLLIKGQKCNI